MGIGTYCCTVSCNLVATTAM